MGTVTAFGQVWHKFDHLELKTVTIYTPNQNLFAVVFVGKFHQMNLIQSDIVDFTRYKTEIISQIAVWNGEKAVVSSNENKQSQLPDDVFPNGVNFAVIGCQSLEKPLISFRKSNLIGTFCLKNKTHTCSSSKILSRFMHVCVFVYVWPVLRCSVYWNGERGKHGAVPIGNASVLLTESSSMTMKTSVPRVWLHTRY